MGTPSKKARWEVACAKALEAIDELTFIQNEFEDEIPDTLSDDQQEKYEELAQLTFDDAINILSEASIIILPKEN